MQKILTLACLLPLLLLHLSCNIAGVIASKTVGQTIPAVYVPVPTDPIIVVAESFNSGASVAVDTDQLARLVTDELSRHQIAPTIDPVKVMDLRSRNAAAFRKTKISEIGRQFGAKQVLYINVLHSGIESAGADVMMRGTASAKLKIVDVETAETRWPEDAAEGYPVDVATTYERVKDGVSESTVRPQLQQLFALEIGRLFRKYAADE